MALQSSVVHQPHPSQVHLGYYTRNSGSSLAQDKTCTETDKEHDQIILKTSVIASLVNPAYNDEVVNKSSPLVNYDKIRYIPTEAMKRHFELVELTQEIERLNVLENGWDGDDSVAPGQEKVKTALDVINSWPRTFSIPTIEPDIDGNIIIEVLDSALNGIVGVDVVETDVVFCSVIRDGEVLYKQRTGLDELPGHFQAIAGILA